MKTWKKLKNEIMQDPLVAQEYAHLAPKYQLISKLISARKKQGFTQRELATKIGTKQSAIARLESGNSNPSFDFLVKVTTALGTNFQINL